MDTATVTMSAVSQLRQFKTAVKIYCLVQNNERRIWTKGHGKEFWSRVYENITLDMNGIKITNLTDRANTPFSLIIHDLSNFRLTKADHNMTYRKINSSKKNL